MKLPHLKIAWYAIEKHREDARKRSKYPEIIDLCYQGFIDNESDMARAINNCKIVIYKGYTYEAAKENSSCILIRGLRNGTDYEYEENISAVNEKIAGLDTCYFRAGDLGYLSSSVVMEIYSKNKSIDKYVPKAVAKLLKRS